MSAQDSIRLMTYNLLNFPDANPARISYLKTILQYTKPDILLVNELNNETGANEVLVNALNTEGINYYSRAPFYNYDIQNNLMYYDTRKIGFLSADTIDASPRPVYYFKVYLKDWDLAQTMDTTYLHLFSVHLKALSGSAYEQQRYNATKKLRNFIDNELNGEHILVGGDFNVYKSSEPCLKVLMDSGIHKLHDPINATGTFNSQSFATIHTQSTRTSDPGDGGSTGGLDDRFDLFLCSEDIYNGTSDLESNPTDPNTYKAIGNDGQHYNIALNDAPSVTIYPSDLVDALYNFSDHLPVVYNLKTNKDLVDGIEFEKKNTLKWYYDLNNNILNIKSPIDNYTGIKIYNQLGQQIKFNSQAGFKEQNINLSGLPKGTYIIRVMCSGEPYNIKCLR